MPWSPMGAGDGSPSEHSFTTDSSFFPMTGILNSAIAMHLQDTENNYQLYVCTGTWNVTNVGSAGPPMVPAKAIFTPSAQDLLSTNPLGKPGLYRAYPVVTLSTGPKPMDWQFLQVDSRP
jgi:hypothetical protein